MSKFYFTSIALICFVANTSAQVFSMVKDINPGTANSSPINLFAAGQDIYFAATNGVNGHEFWKSDGTEAGTIMVKDINPGPASSTPGGFVKLSGMVYFRANDGVHGDELWKTDGTEAGTVLVKDINPGTAGSSISSLVNVNNKLFFSANDGVHGQELWKSDGTESGTVIVKDINTDASTGFPGNNSYPTLLTGMNGFVYFNALNGPNSPALWKSDGTEAGTTLLKAVSIGDIKRISNTLIFSGGGDPATSIWKTDGTAGGTIQLKNTGAINSMTEVDGFIYFYTITSGTLITIWKSDGSANGTVLVKQIAASGAFTVGSFTNVNGKLFFVAPHPTAGTELWESDGTGDGTFMVKDINPGPAGSEPFGLANINGTLYFRATNGLLGKEIWKSDGTEAGTRIVQDIANPGDALPADFTLCGTKLFVTAAHNSYGRELWMASLYVAPGGLPLTITEFAVHKSGNDAILSWKTLAEHNTSHFDVERSTDGRTFVKVSTLAAAGTTAVTTDYEYTDRAIDLLGASAIYYRLKMADLDGKFIYSKIIAITIDTRETLVKIFPNPVIDADAGLMLSVPESEKISCSIIDQNGRVVEKKGILLNSGSNNIPLETAKLPGGVYIILLKGIHTNRRVKFIKQ